MASGSDGLVVSAALHERLLLISKIVSRPKGTVLFRRGDACHGLFLVRRGRVRLVLEPASRLFPDRVLGPGCVVGLPSAVAGSPYSLTAEVVQDAELAWAERHEVTECLRRNPELCFEVMDILSREISGTREVLKRTSSSPNRPRKD
jgi:CRP-like cAMP-binding protein